MINNQPWSFLGIQAQVWGVIAVIAVVLMLIELHPDDNLLINIFKSGLTAGRVLWDLFIGFLKAVGIVIKVIGTVVSAVFTRIGTFIEDNVDININIDIGITGTTLIKIVLGIIALAGGGYATIHFLGL